MIARRWLRRIPVTERWVYTARSGLSAGFRRRGGFGFVPGRKLAPDEAFLKTLNFRDKCVYDVGGFVGLMTLFFSRRARQVITFEPVPQNRAAILDHLELNGIQNVSVLPLALGARVDTVDFLFCAGEPARGTLNDEQMKRFAARKDGRMLRVEVAPMDVAIAEHALPPPDFIKIDVEGSELDVLRGMTQTLFAHRPDLLIELHGVDNEMVAARLLELRYRVTRALDQVPITVDTLCMARRFLFAQAGE